MPPGHTSPRYLILPTNTPLGVRVCVTEISSGYRLLRICVVLIQSGKGFLHSAYVDLRMDAGCCAIARVRSTGEWMQGAARLHDRKGFIRSFLLRVVDGVGSCGHPRNGRSESGTGYFYELE